MRPGQSDFLLLKLLIRKQQCGIASSSQLLKPLIKIAHPIPIKAEHHQKVNLFHNSLNKLA